MSAYRGKVVAVSFFATWCPSCEDWSRELSKLQDEFLAKGAVVIAVTNEPIDSVKSFQSKHAPKFQLLRLSSAPNLFDVARVTAVPTTFVIDKDGTAHGPLVGAFTASGVRELLQRTAS